MAQAINTTAASLDNGSGTEVAKTLTAKSLGHDKFEDLDNKLPKLQEHAGKIVAERNNMAVALRKIAETVEVDNLEPLAKFKELTSYTANTQAVVNKVESVISHQNDTLQRLCDVAKKLKADLTVSALKGDNYSGELGKLDDRINAVNARIKNDDSQLENIFSIAGGSSALDFGDNAYKSSTDKVVGAVRNLKDKYIHASEALKVQGNKVTSLQDSIKAKDGRITGLNEIVSKKTLEIKRLNNIISGSEGANIVVDPWENGSQESRRAAQGKIIKVDRKYGFVVVDLGTGTNIKQRIGKKINYVNPMIPVGAKMIVARNIESTDGEYIGEIKLIKVHEDCSIANVVSVVQGKRVAVGDTVFFSSAQVAAMDQKK
ncbi:MAG: hypothetical protein PHH77_03465 [Victivallaceae bacterium]|nr:hypothetical protein [Victivallaceae bacterium]